MITTISSIIALVSFLLYIAILLISVIFGLMNKDDTG